MLSLIEGGLATHEVYPITVKGPTREGTEERLAELAERYDSLTEQLRTIDPEVC